MDALLTERSLGLDEVVSAVSSPKHGAVVVFLGVVRDSEDGRPIDAIRYEAYAPMAEPLLAEAARRAEVEFGARVEVRHRFGRVPAGEPSLVIAAAAPHRAEAFEAARAVIERIKKDIPIWKAEFE